MLTKLKMSHSQSRGFTYTDYLYEMLRPTNQITTTTLDRASLPWLRACRTTRDQLFNQIENSLWEICDAG